MTEPFTTDQLFIGKLTDIVLVNLKNENFGVKELAHESGMSLYRINRRLYSINKKTSNQFIREVRLQKALEMLQEGACTASEVAFKVGFGSPTYFTKSFHEFFGYPPGKVTKVKSYNPEVNILTQNASENRMRGSIWRTYLLTLSGTLLLALLIGTIGFLIYKKIHKSSWTDNLISSDGRISIAVMPFHNMTNDTTLNIWQDGIQEGLISSLSTNKELKVRQKETINTLIQTKGITESVVISPGVAGKISQKLNANLFIYGNIEEAGSLLRVDAQLIDTKSMDVIESFVTEESAGGVNFFLIIDTLSRKLRNFLLLSKLIKKNPLYELGSPPATNSPEAFRYFVYGRKAFNNGDNLTAISWYLKALDVDSNYFYPMMGLSSAYGRQGMVEPDLKWVLKYYKKRTRWPIVEQLWANWAYSFSFEAPEEGIKYLRQLLQIDDQEPSALYLLGYTYNGIGQYNNAIPVLEKSLEIRRKWGKEYLKSNWAYPNLGYAYQKTGQYRKAKKLYWKAEKYFNDNPNIWDMHAILALTEKDTIAANRYIDRYKTIRKNNSSSEADITAGLAWIYSESGMPDKAEEYYRKAISLEPGNPGLLKDFSNFLIDKNRNLPEVPELMDRAMELVHNKYDYYEYSDIKGWSLHKQGKNPEALDILQRTWDSAQFKMYFIYSHLEQVKKAIAEQK